MALAPEVLLTPGAETLNQGNQSAAVDTEAVAHLGWIGVPHLPLHDPITLQIAEVLGGHLVAGGRDRAALVAVAQWTFLQLPEDRQGPFAVQHLKISPSFPGWIAIGCQVKPPAPERPPRWVNGQTLQMNGGIL